MSTCSDSSSASGGSKPRQRRSRENKKSRKRTASPLVVNPSCIIDTSHHPPVNGLNLGLETKVKVDGMGDHKQVTASLIDLMTEAPKKRIVTRAHKEKDREEVSIQACHLQVEEDRRSFPPGRAVYQHHAEPDEVQGVSNEGEQTVQAEHLLSILRLPETPVQPKGQPHHRRVLRTGPVREGGPGPLVTDSHRGGRPNTDLEVSKYIMLMTADKFCELVLQEKDAKGALTCTDGKMAWKRPVSGVREMCDTCDTTLFNIHWTCPKCGFVVCPDCFKAKTGNSTRSMKAKSPEVWLKCIKDQQHLPENLMLTQIIPGSALWDICTLVHEIRRRWNLPSTCPCSRPKSSPPGDAESTKGNDVKTEVQPEQNAVSSTMVSTTGNTITATSSSTSALDFLADVATSRSNDAKCDFEAPHPPPSQNGETQVDSSSNVKTAADTTTEVTCDPTIELPNGTELFHSQRTSHQDGQ
ncbi:putative JmjC domain-containing histone demethylation protein 2C isoform X2 [Apostichopus japonicus]|uniref:Putative JmjC domain-containing histone demethylation protein 2C isoform X2 n=1 Tax=Stichopus japonicus TaxID=307972 RepID=A0A2G8KLD6_STIJA|nr:putative JmjC domain-containing histone demethylation protein 2C isoform X2 [Apostichopus japonicus]